MDTPSGIEYRMSRVFIFTYVSHIFANPVAELRTLLSSMRPLYGLPGGRTASI
jgi:hypothetical protein